MNTSAFASRPSAFSRRDFLARHGMGMGTVGLAGLSAGCVLRNAMWSTPDSCLVPIQLSNPGVKTKEFKVRSGRYGVYVCHEAPCLLLQEQKKFPQQLDCDVDVKVCRGAADSTVVAFQKRTTKADLMAFGRGAEYGLGFFVLPSGGKFTLTVSNVASRHDDSVCKSYVKLMEILPK